MIRLQDSEAWSLIERPGSFVFLQKHLRSIILCAFVDGADDGDGFAGFSGRCAGLAAFGDGGDHFFEVALVLIEVDCGGVVGPSPAS